MSNPGREYLGTKHNVGLDFIEYYAKKKRLTFNKRSSVMISESDDFVLMKSSTFMNTSGGNLKKLQKIFGKIQPGNLLLCIDHLDLAIGKCRVKNGGSHK